MTDNNETTEAKKPDLETAFIVVKDFEGRYLVTNDLGVTLTVERRANGNDMRQGFRDLLETMATEQVIQGVLARLQKSSPEDSQPNEAEIRQSLPEEEAQ